MGKTYKDRRRFDENYRSKENRNRQDELYYVEGFENAKKRKRKVRQKEMYFEENL
jgi:hypothetical protein